MVEFVLDLICIGLFSYFVEAGNVIDNKVGLWMAFFLFAGVSFVEGYYRGCHSK